MENELQKTVTKITDEKKHLMPDTQQPVGLDGMELKKYIDFVVREVTKDKTINDIMHKIKSASVLLHKKVIIS